MHYGRIRAAVAGLTGLVGALFLGAAGLGLALFGAGPAAAGGPTSVLLSSPESGRTASLYYTEKRYGQLEQALRPPEGTPTADPSASTPPGLATAMDSPRVTVTWMVHDTEPWRVDQVYPVKSRSSTAVWIHTTNDSGGAADSGEAADAGAANDPGEAEAAYWHRAQDPEGLLVLLERLEVLDGDAIDGAESGRSSAESPRTERTPIPDTQRTAAEAELTVADGMTGWWWAIPGAGAGAALALSFRQAVRGARDLRGRRGRQPEDDERSLPRQELIDN